MVAPTEQDIASLAEVLQERFAHVDEEVLSKTLAAFRGKRPRRDRAPDRAWLNKKWEADGFCTFKDMNERIGKSTNTAVVRKRLAIGTAEAFGWTIESKDKKWFATKEGAAPKKYKHLAALAKRSGGVDPIQTGLKPRSLELTKATNYLLSIGAKHIGSGYYRIEE